MSYPLVSWGCTIISVSYCYSYWIIVDEKWVLYDNRKWKAHWLNWEVVKQYPNSDLLSNKILIFICGLTDGWCTLTFCHGEEVVNYLPLWNQKLWEKQLSLVNYAGPVFFQDRFIHLCKKLILWGIWFCLSQLINLTLLQQISAYLFHHLDSNFFG